MLLRYFYNDTLAHASYIVGCQASGDALIVDPGRDVDPYLEEAEARELSITAVTESHIHADFLAGSRELAERTGATLYLSDEGDADWKYQYADDYEHVRLHDGDVFMVGNVKLDVMHTPGHTPEHISLVVTDTAGADEPMGIFTGDFVFVGDVGRPDLLEKAAGQAGTSETGARQMFESIARFKELPDHMQVWPAHGAGSACGKALGAVPSTTVGYEKRFNWAMQFDDEDTFVQELLSGQPEPPKYFAMMKKLNREGPAVLHGIPVPEHLPASRLSTVVATGATVVDTRPAGAFAAGHIPGTINLPHDGSFTNWAGWLLDYDAPFYLIAGERAIVDVMRDLTSIGLDNAAGYFTVSAIEAWQSSGRSLQQYEVTNPRQAHEHWSADGLQFVDVRNQSEWDEGHIPGATHIMLGYLPERVDELPRDKQIVITCQSGARSAIGASILQARGITHVANMMGGFAEWKSSDLPVERNGAG